MTAAEIAFRTIGALFAVYCPVVALAAGLAVLIDWARRMTAPDPFWSPGPERGAVLDDEPRGPPATESASGGKPA